MKTVNRIDVSTLEDKDIYDLGDNFRGTNLNGDEISFTNYYMKYNQQAVMPISGEYQYSRGNEYTWEDEILKMKAGGITVIATYVFWIHHEELEGDFDFTGNKNLRKFTELCKKHDMQLIVRIGPFDHGECRNGGFPDWLYGKPFEARALNDGFLFHVKALYQEVAKQLDGLYFKDNGPIIGVQIDNEYTHSAAPWQEMEGTTNTWLPTGHEGDAYMLTLKDMAIDLGIQVPFYTVTAWGGSPTPDCMLPLWGAYAFRPWIYYHYTGPHPATKEYLYRDHHNNNYPEVFDFKPFYQPEEKPYSCCEMQGGMFSSYLYRFELPGKSVDAMANIKLASGCNFLGYYMYHGGTHPKGKKTLYLNEGLTPNISYDFQAAIGEYGQLRPSYKRLNRIHALLATFGRDLSQMKTVLPDNWNAIDPEDVETLRYAVRAKGGSGFLFINNYQDHMENKDICDETIEVELKEEKVVFAGLSLGAQESCILPFNMNLEGIVLKKATAQPLTRIIKGDDIYYFFYSPKGMKSHYSFEEGTTVQGDIELLEVTKESHKIYIVTLSDEESLDYFHVNLGGEEAVMLLDAQLMASKSQMKIATTKAETRLSLFPALSGLKGNSLEELSAKGIFTNYRIHKNQKVIVPMVKEVGPHRYTVEIAKGALEGIKDALLEINYSGDIGQAFINGEMVADNFNNNTVWHIGLLEFMDRLECEPLTILITPLKEGAKVNVESTMAGRKEDVANSRGEIESIKVTPIYEHIIGC